MSNLLRHFTYKDWQELCKSAPLPALFVDLNQFEENVLTLKKISEKTDKKLRLATKSIRIPFLIEQVLKIGSPTYQGLMCFSVKEAYELFRVGHKDILVAYPTHSEDDLSLVKEMMSLGGRCVLTFDHHEHLSWAANSWKKISTVPLEICLDIDASLKFFGLHLGVRRSSILSSLDFLERLNQLANIKELKLTGILHYEAQVAGLPDRDNEFILIQKIKQLIRQISIKLVNSQRKDLSKILNDKSLKIDFINGGGTGSIDFAVNDPLTEVTAGSGLLHSHLFDKYSNCHTAAALFIALEVTRLPSKEMVTCQSGGFIASGEVSKNKSPEIHLPRDLKIISSENYGEVQTPFQKISKQDFKLGDPIILRPAKAGEIMERFNEVILIRDKKIVGITPTYRGNGWNFF